MGPRTKEIWYSMSGKKVPDSQKVFYSNKHSKMREQKISLNLTSSNFWTAVALAIAGFFVGFPEDAATNGVEYVVGIIGAVKAIREYFKQYGVKPDIEHAVNSSNFWNYISVIVVTLVPTIPVEMIDSVRDVAVNIIGQNWQGVLVGVFSLVTILYNVFWKKTPAKA